MASEIFHPLLYLIASATKQELIRQIHYLKVENQILRARLPKNMKVSPDECKRLLKAAKGVGKALRELTSIVTYNTFLKWMREVSRVPPGVPKRKPGRPKIPAEIRDLVLKIAREGHWGRTHFQHLRSIHARHQLNRVDEKRSAGWQRIQGTLELGASTAQ